ncbi:uncharacterized protein B0I36DRAFT_72827 [Microdochium trichocladiopsis]|uniref:Secreted protein n=1 Tax=Microdochium trichocladiopsis TaxID=1682393 RepID=A0A9P9BUR6_9PEZI|nr:uncharacterized protein B0I36DRAFT_72827 [Microdochium trichocladiopsis]KAH7037916.1 hypothetical protein B0I36DRAFT_72827 [Microdochium trichocladiopsis]
MIAAAIVVVVLLSLGSHTTGSSTKRAAPRLPTSRRCSNDEQNKCVRWETRQAKNTSQTNNAFILYLLVRIWGPRVVTAILACWRAQHRCFWLVLVHALSLSIRGRVWKLSTSQPLHCCQKFLPGIFTGSIIRLAGQHETAAADQQ